jgi:hypothetical protein
MIIPAEDGYLTINCKDSSGILSLWHTICPKIITQTISIISLTIQGSQEESLAFFLYFKMAGNQLFLSPLLPFLRRLPLPFQHQLQLPLQDMYYQKVYR